MWVWAMRSCVRGTDSVAPAEPGNAFFTQCEPDVVRLGSPEPWEQHMNNGYFFAQDQAGNLQKVHVIGPPVASDDSRAGAARAGYALDDGSAVERIDNDTFKVVGTGALVTLVRE